MKTRIIFFAFIIAGMATFTSCKKDYTCTCTTVVGSASETDVHSINNATYGAAVRSCKNYEDQANNSLPGGTTCHL